MATIPTALQIPHITVYRAAAGEDSARGSERIARASEWSARASELNMAAG